MLRYTLLVLGFLVAISTAGVATADERVPHVGNDDLPIVGTCGRIEKTNVTHVMVGKVGWYKVAGIPEPVSFERLQVILKQRAGSERPSPHSVWFQASKHHVWAHVVKARLACAQAGIYRVGIRVISETDRSQVYGFPLFLPAVDAHTGPAAATATRLPLIVDPVNAEASSDPKFLWRAATHARDKFDQDVVAEIRIANNVNLQYAMTVLDMLHRAGCVAVRIKNLQLVSRVKDANQVQIRIVRKPRYPKDWVLSAEIVEPFDVPKVEPRASTWPLHGANRPGALYLELEELPIPGEKRPTRVRAAGGAFPNYLRRGRVPGTTGEEVTSRICTWAGELGPKLLASRRASAVLKDVMAVRLREPGKLAPLVGPISKAFPEADRIDVTTLRLDVLLFHEGQPVGLLDVTLHIGQDQVSCVFAKRGGGAMPGARNVPPEPVDPFAAGVPGAVRVWLEGLLIGLKRDPPAAVPLTPMAIVLRGVPESSHTRLRGVEGARGPDAAAMTAYVRGLRFERIVLRIREARAAVSARGRVVGVIRFGLESEEKELRINALDPRRAR